MQDAKKIAKKSPSGHNHTTLSGYIFARKARIDNRKKLLSSNISSTCPDNMVNFQQTRMWANAQPDGRPAEHRWRPLFNAAKFS